jgi:hypothetical protein
VRSHKVLNLDKAASLLAILCQFSSDRTTSRHSASTSVKRGVQVTATAKMSNRANLGSD